MPSINTAGQKCLLEWFKVTKQGRDTVIPRIQSRRSHKVDLVWPYCLYTSLAPERTQKEGNI